VTTLRKETIGKRYADRATILFCVSRGMTVKSDSENMSGVCVTESLARGEDNKESFILKGENDCEKAKLEFRKFERERKRPMCSSKNAVLARMNRLKKKYFVESLQRDVARLCDENAKLKQTLEGQSSLVCSLRKEVCYLKGVLANNKDISMLLKSIRNMRLPVTSSLSKHCQPNQIHATADHNYVCTRSGTNIESSFSDLINDDGAYLTLDDEKEPVPVIADVPLCLSKPHDNIVDLPLLSPSDGNLCDTEFSGCYLVQPTTFDSPEAGCAADDELFMDAGVCLHVAKRRVSLEFCSTCSSNALLALDDVDKVE
jgi:hypothetical protein